MNRISISKDKIDTIHIDLCMILSLLLKNLAQELIDFNMYYLIHLISNYFPSWI